MMKPTFLLALAALGGSASALTLSFPDLTIPAGPAYLGDPADPVYSTTALSGLGPLENGATLSFTLASEGDTWISDLRFSLVDPGGATPMALLPDALDEPGDYTGKVGFASANPGSGAYALSFANAFGSAFDATLSNIRLEVTPTAVPEPTSFAFLGLGALVLRRRRRGELA